MLIERYCSDLTNARYKLSIKKLGKPQYLDKGKGDLW